MKIFASAGCNSEERWRVGGGGSHRPRRRGRAFGASARRRRDSGSERHRSSGQVHKRRLRSGGLHDGNHHVPDRAGRLLLSQQHNCRQTRPDAQSTKRGELSGLGTTFRPWAIYAPITSKCFVQTKCRGRKTGSVNNLLCFDWRRCI